MVNTQILFYFVKAKLNEFFISSSFESKLSTEERGLN